MIIVLQVVGGLAVLLGLAAAIYGIPIQEFSFGNTLIQAGTVGFCTGLILLGLSVVATELRQLSRRLASVRPAGEPRPRPALPPVAPAAAAPADGGPLFARDQSAPSPANAGPAEVSLAPPGAPPPSPSSSLASPPPWREERVRPDAPPLEPEAAEPAPQQKQRRNLLFASTVRKDRERQAPAPDPRVVPPPIEPAPEANEAAPPSFEDAWPKADRARPPEAAPTPRRPNRMPPPSAEPGAGPASERTAPGAPGGVTVVKSGVVNGMHYSFYSDGSIEAQLSEGTMRFASFDELMAHIGQRS
jgi:hypothetical protein